ncbi:MAG: hypothetical protein VX044_05510, partial [Planctomycetota bacterium]|nr:hypothetical protein [Planctomycetota bacterium]
ATKHRFAGVVFEHELFDHHSLGEDSGYFGGWQTPRALHVVPCAARSGAASVEAVCRFSDMRTREQR